MEEAEGKFKAIQEQEQLVAELRRGLEEHSRSTMQQLKALQQEKAVSAQLREELESARSEIAVGDE